MTDTPPSAVDEQTPPAASSPEPPEGERRWVARAAPWLIFGVAVYVAWWGVTRHWDWSVDDAAISFAYAENVARGAGWVHSRGSAVVEGFSNPLWVFWLIGASWLGLDLVASAKVLSCVFLLGMMLLCLLLPSRIHGRPLRAVDGLAPMWVATATSTMIWSVTGLENALYGCLIIAATYLAATERPGRPWSALALLAVAMTRPEGILYVAPIGLMKLSRCRDRAARRDLILFSAIGLTGLAIFLAWRWSTFAELLPNTAVKVDAQRKALSVFDLEAPGVRYLLDYFDRFDYLLIAPLVALGLTASPRRRIRLMVAGLIGVALFFPFYSGGDWMKNHRFLTTLPALVGVAMVLGVDRLAEIGRRWTAAPRMLAGAAALAVFLPTCESRVRLIEERPGPATSLGFHHRTAHALIRLDEHIGGHRLKAYLSGIGAPSWMTPVKILDMGALADRTIGRLADTDKLRAYVYTELRPDVLWAAASWQGHPSVRGAPTLSHGYLPFERHENYPLWKYGYVRVRRGMVVEDVPPRLATPEQRLGNLHVLGLDPLPERMAPGDRARIGVYVMARRKLPKGVRIELELLGAGVERRRWPLEPLVGPIKTSAWFPGDVMRLRGEVELPRGGGRVTLSLTAGTKGQPWRTPDQRSAMPLGEIELSPGDHFTPVSARFEKAIEQGEVTEAEQVWRLMRSMTPLPPTTDLPAGMVRSIAKEKKITTDGRGRPMRDPERHAALLDGRRALARAHCAFAAEADEPARRWRGWRRAQGWSETRCGFEAELARALTALGDLRWSLRAAHVVPEDAHLRRAVEARRQQEPVDGLIERERTARDRARAFHRAPTAAGLSALMQSWVDIDRPARAVAICRLASALCEQVDPALRARAARL